MALMKQRRASERMPNNKELMQRCRQEMQQVADLSAWLERYWPMPVFGGGA